MCVGLVALNTSVRQGNVVSHVFSVGKYLKTRHVTLSVACFGVSVVCVWNTLSTGWEIRVEVESCTSCVCRWQYPN